MSDGALDVNVKNKTLYRSTDQRNGGISARQTVGESMQKCKSTKPAMEKVSQFHDRVSRSPKKNLYRLREIAREQEMTTFRPEQKNTWPNGR
jgi:hypothetical protein